MVSVLTIHTAHLRRRLRAGAASTFGRPWPAAMIGNGRAERKERCLLLSSLYLETLEFMYTEIMMGGGAYKTQGHNKKEKER